MPDSGSLDTGFDASDGDDPVECTSNDACDGICREGSCVAPSCDDGIRNGDETDVDCGGPDCEPCSKGARCEKNSDCASVVCTAEQTCAAPSCDDEIENGSETDVDCGGPNCAPCRGGAACEKDGDCASRNCKQGSCRAGTCSDGIENGNETDVDCGGDDSPCPPCSRGDSCQNDDDCESRYCNQGTCAEATCMNGNEDGQETDVDCGGPECPECGVSETCDADSDCRSGVCSPAGRCQSPTCSDSTENGKETDVDCGGPDCGGCASGEACNSSSDCKSGLACSTNSGTCTSLNSKSIELSGSNSYGSIPHSPPLSVTKQLTIEAWVKPTSSSGHRDIIGQHNGSYRLRLTSGGNRAGHVWLLLRYSDGSYGTYTSATTVPLDTWTHVAVTFDSNTGAIRFFIDGSLDKTTSGKSLDIQTRSYTMDFGYYAPTNSEFFHGKIDELRLWKTARTKSQINNEMKTTLSGSNSDLVGYWNAESQPSQKLRDQTPNNIHISVTNVSFATDTPF